MLPVPGAHPLTVIEAPYFLRSVCSDGLPASSGTLRLGPSHSVRMRRRTSWLCGTWVPWLCLAHGQGTHDQPIQNASNRCLRDVRRITLAPYLWVDCRPIKCLRNVRSTSPSGSGSLSHAAAGRFRAQVHSSQFLRTSYGIRRRHAVSAYNFDSHRIPLRCPTPNYPTTRRGQY
ncbi:hypothetical protein BD309DRAFT_566669 [Dichomitus squalens]|uniref:Uncharacterized protein n=1 Tax=Dichomitus squalens TaxID=114155 RepID=A0A4Q9NC64_9APHY|nr:hypothetical protein BD309DRAFT_566669 [Dichomitus squalens]TBU58922.1 hypothetical protein BD310DRAFT_440037 [Dichomitus squalens]